MDAVELVRVQQRVGDVRGRELERELVRGRRLADAGRAAEDGDLDAQSASKYRIAAWPSARVPA
jgi:hypothetical protein